MSFVIAFSVSQPVAGGVMVLLASLGWFAWEVRHAAEVSEDLPL